MRADFFSESNSLDYDPTCHRWNGGKSPVGNIPMVPGHEHSMSVFQATVFRSTKHLLDMRTNSNKGDTNKLVFPFLSWKLYSEIFGVSQNRKVGEALTASRVDRAPLAPLTLSSILASTRAPKQRSN